MENNIILQCLMIALLSGIGSAAIAVMISMAYKLFGMNAELHSRMSVNFCVFFLGLLNRESSFNIDHHKCG